MTLIKEKIDNIAFIKTYHYPKGATASKVIKDSSCDVLINGVLFDNRTKTALTRIKVDGFKYGSYFSKFGIGVKNDKELFWGNIFDYLNNEDVRHFICSAPTLIVDGKVSIDKEGLKNDFLNQMRNRTAIGFNDNEFILYTSDNHIGFNKLSDNMLGFGCKYALSTDGGGSSCLIYKGKVVNGRYDGRKITHWIGVKLKEKKEDDKVENGMESICLDYGHNGRYNNLVDCGAVSKDGKLKEADVVYNLGIKLKKELERHGIKVVETRGKDVLVSSSKNSGLQKRCDISNKANCDYFISLHTNSSDNTIAKGIETYSLSNKGNGSNLAHSVQLELDKLGRPSRGKKEANFYVLKNTNASAILIELGFISNQEEQQLLSSDEFLNKSAILITKGILGHLGIKYKEEVGDIVGNKYPADLSDWAKEAYDFVVSNGISDGTNPKQPLTAERLWGTLLKFDKYLKKDGGK